MHSAVTNAKAFLQVQEEFGSFSDYIHFDKRGTGASDVAQQVPGIDERVDDMRAVMDAAGIERAHLFGASEGGSMAVLFAVTYPHRVESLILNGTSARFAPDDEDEATRAAWTITVGSASAPASSVAASFCRLMLRL